MHQLCIYSLCSSMLAVACLHSEYDLYLFLHNRVSTVMKLATCTIAMIDTTVVCVVAVD